MEPYVAPSVRIAFLGWTFAYLVVMGSETRGIAAFTCLIADRSGFQGCTTKTCMRLAYARPRRRVGADCLSTEFVCPVEDTDLVLNVEHQEKKNSDSHDKTLA